MADSDNSSSQDSGSDESAPPSPDSSNSGDSSSQDSGSDQSTPSPSPSPGSSDPDSQDGSDDPTPPSSLHSIASHATAASTNSAPSSLPSNEQLSNLPMSSGGYTPADPFWPRWPAQGPIFLDTSACICALQSTPNNNTDNQAWRCQGNSSSYAYVGTSGKWFNAPNSGNLSISIDDASNPPELGNSLIYSNDTKTLIPLQRVNPDPLSVFDDACTGVNETTFSTAYYRESNALARNETAIDGLPCLRPGALPIPIRNVTEWQKDGCGSGFFCPNNTINSLPEYCYPVEPCAKARLLGQQCVFSPNLTISPNVNFGQGPFEPAMCTAGFYCPKAAKKQLPCPAGSYCPPGSEKPIPCGPGSHCSAGSQNETSLLPFGVLIIVDVLLIVAILYLGIRARRALSRKSHEATKSKHSMQSLLPRHRHFKERKASYKQIEDDDDAEAIPLEAKITPLRRVPTGFQAALDEAYMHDNAAERGIDIDSSIELRQFVDSMRKAIQGSNFGLSFGYENLSFQPRGSKKPILSKISGFIGSGSLVGVMGGSGAGKSTFVNVLMGKATHTGGTVKVNGVATKMKQYKKIIGYVPQDDIVLPELTVRENILHSARIRLPSSWAERDVQNHADAVVDCLDLTHVRDSRVGSVAAPIISGGQRKRVSIGMELAAAPMAIFLDEPTSGLDATAASSIMKTLKALSHLGMSIIVIIHQPRVEIFEMIDDLILLGNGRLIYQGPDQGAQPYFAGLGFDFPEHCNGGDVVTDIITGNGRPYKRIGDISKDALISHWESISSSRPHRASISSKVESASLNLSIKGRGAPPWRQIRFCLSRALLQQYRTLSSFWFEMGVAAFGGFLIGLAQNGQKGVNFSGFFLGDFEILSSAVDYKSIPIMALLVCISIGLIAAAPGVRVFGEEYLVFRREASSGHSRLAYYIAKVVSTVPRMVLACFHFTVFFIMLATPVIPWGAAFLANMLYFYCIYGLASVVSMIVRQADGPLFAVMASLIVGVLSGASPSLSKVETWHVGWLWRSSPGVWLAEIYFGRNVFPLAGLYDVQNASNVTGFALNRFTTDCLALLLIGTIYRVVAYGGLLVSRRIKR